MNSSIGNEFTDQEIKEQLKKLGFKNISQEKFNQFKRDLEKLIANEITMNSTDASFVAVNNFDSNKIKKHVHVTFPDRSQRQVDQHDEQSLLEGENEVDQSFVSITTTSSIVDNKVLKRKIVRKTNPNQRHKKMVDLNQGMRSMKLTEPEIVHNTNEETSQHESMNNTLQEEGEYELLHHSINNEDEIQNYEASYHSNDEIVIKLNENYAPVNYPVKSFIRSQSSVSLRSVADSQNNRLADKANPVKKYQDYKKMWNRHKVPGEKKHSDLRWSIREQMLEKHVIVKRPQKSYARNEYIVPTEKKRSQLRWIVRSALANPV